MNIFDRIGVFFSTIINCWRGLDGRLKAALDRLQKRLDVDQYIALIDKLKQAHDQAEAVLRGEPLPADHLPWELVNGLALLNMLGDRKALPRKPDDLLTRVLPDGSLLGCHQWELLDFHWAEALVAWLENLDDRAPFGTTPAFITMPNDVVLAIAGDWGTGDFVSNAPSVLVANAIKNIQPDYTFHLGDVYYAGSKSEALKNMSGWPRGKSGAFTLNSNHEMYSGANPYFAMLKRQFPEQQNTSYFALQNDFWLVIGVDSVYDSDPMNLYMDGDLNRVQLDWLRALPKNKKIIVLSHHQPFDIDGKKTTKLYDQVVGALGAVPAYWYWGHLHNAICYAPQNGFYGRCVGHGAIPYGDAKQLCHNDRIAWYEDENAGDKNYPERVLNGFLTLKLSGDKITEQFIAEDGRVRWSSV